MVGEGHVAHGAQHLVLVGRPRDGARRRPRPRTAGRSTSSRTQLLEPAHGREAEVAVQAVVGLHPVEGLDPDAARAGRGPGCATAPRPGRRPSPSAPNRRPGPAPRGRRRRTGRPARATAPTAGSRSTSTRRGDRRSRRPGRRRRGRGTARRATPRARRPSARAAAPRGARPGWSRRAQLFELVRSHGAQLDRRTPGSLMAATATPRTVIATSCRTRS